MLVSSRQDTREAKRISESFQPLSDACNSGRFRGAGSWEALAFHRNVFLGCGFIRNVKWMLRRAIQIYFKALESYRNAAHHLTHIQILIVMTTVFPPGSHNNARLRSTAKQPRMVGRPCRKVRLFHHRRIGCAKSKQVGHAQCAIAPTPRKADALANGRIIFRFVGSAGIQPDEHGVASVAVHAIAFKQVAAPLAPERVPINAVVRQDGFSFNHNSNQLRVRQDFHLRQLNTLARLLSASYPTPIARPVRLWIFLYEILTRADLRHAPATFPS